MKKLIAVAAVMALATSAHANLLTNGDFETGAGQPPVGWTYGQAGWSNGNVIPETKPATTGVWNGDNSNATKAAFVSHGGENNGSRWIYQTINTTPFTVYTLSGMIAGGAGAAQPLSGVAWWEVGYIDGNYSAAAIDGVAAGNLAIKREVNGAAGGFGWESFSKDFLALAPTTTIFLKYGWATNWNYHGAYFDNISVEVVPEPGSMLALGSGLLGMAGMMIRRRK